MYETLSTRLVRRPDRVIFLKDLFQKLPIHPVDDLPYREVAIRQTVDEQSPYSLADNVIRLMLSDPNLRIATLLTFNPRDFYDICAKRNIQLVQASDAQIHK